MTLTPAEKQLKECVHENAQLRGLLGAERKENARLEDRLFTSTARNAVKIATMRELLEEADNYAQHGIGCKDPSPVSRVCTCGLVEWQDKVEKVLEHQE